MKLANFQYIFVFKQTQIIISLFAVILWPLCFQMILVFCFVQLQYYLGAPFVSYIRKVTYALGIDHLRGGTFLQ